MRGMALLVDVLHKLPRPHFPSEYVPCSVHRHAFGGAGAFHLERIRNPVLHFAGRELADADAALPPGVLGDAVRLGVGDVDESVAQGDAARTAELLPLGEVPAVEVEDLDAVVAAVGD